MKLIKLLSVLTLFFSLALLQSCEDDPCEGVTCLNDGICLDGTCDCSTGYSGADCGTHCSEDLIGTWTVTGGQSSLCDFASYEFAKGSTDTEIIVSLTATDGTVVPGTGTLSFDCSSLTYTTNISVNGTITFNGTSLTDDVLDGTCTIEATKN